MTDGTSSVGPTNRALVPNSRETSARTEASYPAPPVNDAPTTTSWASAYAAGIRAMARATTSIPFSGSMRPRMPTISWSG